MALTINTNMGSLVVQNNLEIATKSLNKSIERMTTGYKINSAGDDAAGYSVATRMKTHLSSTAVCQANVEMGISLLSTAESNYDIIIEHLQRIRDLTEEAANGTYGADSLAAIKAEITARYAEIDRVAANCDYNGVKLMKSTANGGVAAGGIDLRVGTDSTDNSKINIPYADIFGEITAAGLTGKSVTDYNKLIDPAEGTYSITNALNAIDAALTAVTTKQTKIGAYQNRLDSSASALNTQYNNLSSSLSTVKDADIASESSAFIKSQILQQASASLLATANQTPSIALNLI